MATYIKLCNGDCQDALSCGCSGCGTLQDAVDGATSIFVDANGIISGTLSTAYPFTASTSTRCDGNGACEESPDLGYFCCSISSNICGFGLIRRYIIGNDGCYFDLYVVSGQLVKSDGICYLNLNASWYWNSCGPDGGIQSGSLNVPLTDVIGTHSIPMTGSTTINGEESPWNTPSIITIS